MLVSTKRFQLPGLNDSVCSSDSICWNGYRKHLIGPVALKVRACSSCLSFYHFYPIVNLLVIGVCCRLLSFPNIRVLKLIHGVVTEAWYRDSQLSVLSCLTARLLFSRSGIYFRGSYTLLTGVLVSRFALTAWSLITLSLSQRPCAKRGVMSLSANPMQDSVSVRVGHQVGNKHIRKGRWWLAQLYESRRIACAS